MRTLVIGNTPVSLQGGPIALKEYRDAFDRSMTADAAALTSGRADMDIMLRCAWAMAKAADPFVQPYGQWSVIVMSDQVKPEPDLEFFKVAEFMSTWGKAVFEAILAEIFRIEAPKAGEGDS